MNKKNRQWVRREKETREEEEEKGESGWKVSNSVKHVTKTNDVLCFSSFHHFLLFLLSSTFLFLFSFSFSSTMKKISESKEKNCSFKRTLGRVQGFVFSFFSPSLSSVSLSIYISLKQYILVSFIPSYFSVFWTKSLKGRRKEMRGKKKKTFCASSSRWWPKNLFCKNGDQRIHKRRKKIERKNSREKERKNLKGENSNF